MRGRNGVASDDMPLKPGEAERRINLVWAAALHQACCWRELGVMPGFCRPRPREDQLVMLAVQRSARGTDAKLDAVIFWADWARGLVTLPRHQQRGMAALGLLGEGSVDIDAEWMRLCAGDWDSRYRSEDWLIEARRWKPYPHHDELKADAKAGTERLSRWLWRSKAA